MAIPATFQGTVFDAIEATTTVELTSTTLPSFVELAHHLLLEVVGDGSANYALDIQGRVSPDGTYTNLDYIEIEKAGAAALSTSQLTVNDTTTRFYLVPNPPRFVQLVATRSAGALTVIVSGSTQPLNQYLLTTARGSIYVEGPTADDAAQAGQPLQVGGLIDDTSPNTGNEGDVKLARVSTDGNWLTELYIDNSQLKPISAMPGASEVKQARGPVAGASTSRQDVVTASAGKKIRLISVSMSFDSSDITGFEYYFGDGANITSNAGKEIADFRIDQDVNPIVVMSWPDGAGPVGAADDEFSFRAVAANGNPRLDVIYREE